MLTQEYDINEYKIKFPIAYASHSLSQVERNYRITDFKSLAVIWANQYFESYIHGIHFTIINNY